MIHYPDEFKVIMQSKEVDIHSLIGNIGGYLGLFLGNLKSIIFNINTKRLFVIFKRSFNKNHINLSFLGCTLVQIPDLVFAIHNAFAKRIFK